MKFKSIQTYQAVMWNKSNTHFISNARKGHEDVEITYHKEGYVHIKSAKDEVIIFPANIAYAVPLSSPSEAKVEANLPKFKAK